MSLSISMIDIAHGHADSDFCDSTHQERITKYFVIVGNVGKHQKLFVNWRMLVRMLLRLNRSAFVTLGRQDRFWYRWQLAATLVCAEAARKPIIAGSAPCMILLSLPSVPAWLWLVPFATYRKPRGKRLLMRTAQKKEYYGSAQYQKEPIKCVQRIYFLPKDTPLLRWSRTRASISYAGGVKVDLKHVRLCYRENSIWNGDAPNCRYSFTKLVIRANFMVHTHF